MDTISEIRRDEWWQNNLGGCQTCKWHTRRSKYDICDYYGTDCENISECDNWIERGLSDAKSRKAVHGQQRP